MNSEFKIVEQKCKICMSPLRDEIDGMLSREITRDDGRHYRYEDIVTWANDRGLYISESGLSRHRSNHQQPSLQAALQAQDYIDAINAATGRKLSLHSALSNIIVSKVLRLLDDSDLSEIDPEKAMRLAIMAGRNAMHFEKTEKLLREKEVAQEVSDKLRTEGLSDDVIAQIEEKVLGLTR